MTTKIPYFALLAFAIAATAAAGEVAGVKLDDTLTVEGKALRLNGMGLRKKVIFKVYVAGLYLESRSNDASAVLSRDQGKSIQLHLLRNLSSSELSEAIAEGFWKNVKGPRTPFEARLRMLTSMIPSVKEGDVIGMTYLPGKGTVVIVNKDRKGVIEGKDFSDTLFSVWLGENPVQADLKKALLGE